MEEELARRVVGDEVVRGKVELNQLGAERPDHDEGGGAERFGRLEGYGALGRAHQRAHEVADELLQMAAAKRGQEARARLAELGSARDDLLSALAILVQDIRPDAPLGIQCPVSTGESVSD